MNKKKESEIAYLQTADLERLEEAAAWNHHQWMTLKAQVIDGEEHQADGVTWIYTPGPESEGMILFPRLTEANADEQLDAIVAYYRHRPPQKLVGCWSLSPPRPWDLGVRLLARGFQIGWRPRWMWLDLEKMVIDHPKPPDLRIEQVLTEPDWDIDELPFYNRATNGITYAASQLRPQRVWHFAAWLDSKPVGHATLCLTTGPLGVAGIYDVGVIPKCRNKGIGKAVTLAACLHAQAMGCRHALLNGTGERMYQQIGFERIGFGRTWWLNVQRLNANPPSPTQIAFAEAIGRGDVDTLDLLAKQLEPDVVDVSLTNGMMPMELAVEMGKLDSVKWLVAHGVTLDVLSAWDLGWKHRVSQLLAENPELVNKCSGDRQTTPLHEAAERNDIELAHVVLVANPDLEVRDVQFHATPLDWAKHLQRTELVRLIEAHQARQSPK